MSAQLKQQIIEALEKARQEERLRVEKIREIVRSAVLDALYEAKEGSSEIRSLVQTAMEAALETFQEKGEEVQEEVTAAMEGAIGGLSNFKRQAIAKTQGEIQQLQAKIETEEQELQQDVATILTNLKQEGEVRFTDFQTAINSAITTIQESEEMALLQKRYAQLRAKAAIVQASLAERYGDSYEDIKKYLDEAQNWYEKAKENPEFFTEKIKQQHSKFEENLGQAGSALAKKEKQVQQVLRELWQSLTELFRDTDSPSR